jgi:hypothetical protein
MERWDAEDVDGTMGRGRCKWNDETMDCTYTSVQGSHETHATYMHTNRNDYTWYTLLCSYETGAIRHEPIRGLSSLANLANLAQWKEALTAIL